MIKRFGILVLCLAGLLSAQKGDLFEREETLAKEQALLDLRVKALQEAEEKFDRERREWKEKQQAEILLRSADDPGAQTLDSDSRKRMLLNGIISKAFAEFLFENGRTGFETRLVLVSFQADEDGKVQSVSFLRSDIAPDLEKQIRKIVEKLDLSLLEKESANLSHQFPLLIKK